jgi:hypothetical protein
MKALARRLSHSHYQEAPQGTTGQGSEESEYDDRQSVFPFIEKEQRLETFTHDGAAESESKDATHQRELVKWTKILACVTAALAFATFIVAFVSVLGARDTARLAEAASIQANTAVDTAQRQLRAYVFVDDMGITGIDSGQGPETLIRIKNGGLTPAYGLVNQSAYTNVIGYPLKEALKPVTRLRLFTNKYSFSELGPGSTHDKKRRHRPITPLEIAGLRAGTFAIYFYGEVNFTDAFGCHRWMRYKGILGGPAWDHFPNLAIAGDGNDASDQTAQDCLFKAP